MLLYLSVHKQTWEYTANILIERSRQTFYSDKGNNG